MARMCSITGQKSAVLKKQVIMCAVITGLLSASGPSFARQARHSNNVSSLAGHQVVLTRQPGGELDTIARKLNADDLATAARHKEIPLVLVGSAALSPDGRDTALFVQVQSASLCGSAGCSTDVYLKKGDDWVKILDSVSGPVTVLPRRHDGMYDIVVDGTDRWVWRKGAYHDTLTLTDGPSVTKPAPKKPHEVHTGLRG